MALVRANEGQIQVYCPRETRWAGAQGQRHLWEADPEPPGQEGALSSADFQAAQLKSELAYLEEKEWLSFSLFFAFTLSSSKYLSGAGMCQALC